MGESNGYSFLADPNIRKVVLNIYEYVEPKEYMIAEWYANRVNFDCMYYKRDWSDILHDDKILVKYFSEDWEMLRNFWAPSRDEFDYLRGVRRDNLDEL